MHHDSIFDGVSRELTDTELDGVVGGLGFVIGLFGAAGAAGAIYYSSGRATGALDNFKRQYGLPTSRPTPSPSSHLYYRP